MAAAKAKSDTLAAPDGRPLPASVSALPPTEKGSVVYLLGTAHVSAQSSEDVRQAVASLNPQLVMVELCASRTAMLLARRPGEPGETSLGEVVSLWRRGKGNLFALLYVYFVQKIAAKLKADAGDEFRVAYEEAQRTNAAVVLGDRPVHITLQRAWRALSSVEKVLFVLQMTLSLASLLLRSDSEVRSQVENIRQSNRLHEAMQALSSRFPSLAHVLVKERDIYMISSLRRCLEQLPQTRILAVVGAAHVPGITAMWGDRFDRDQVRELAMPPPNDASPPATPWLKPAIFGLFLLFLYPGLLFKFFLVVGTALYAFGPTLHRVLLSPDSDPLPPGPAPADAAASTGPSSTAAAASTGPEPTGAERPKFVPADDFEHEMLKEAMKKEDEKLVEQAYKGPNGNLQQYDLAVEEWARAEERKVMREAISLLARARSQSVELPAAPSSAQGASAPDT